MNTLDAPSTVPLWVCEHCRQDGVPDIPADARAVLKRAGTVALCWDHLAVLVTYTEPVSILPVDQGGTVVSR